VAWSALWSRWFTDAADGSTHSAAKYALRRWNLALPRIQPTSGPVGDRQWYVNSLDLTLLKVGPGSFNRPPASQEQMLMKTRRPAGLVTVAQPFYVSDAEVTVSQFKKWQDDKYDLTNRPRDWFPVSQINDPPPEAAANARWHDAAMFCNWLSRLEGLEPAYRLSGVRETFPNLPGNHSFEGWEPIPNAPGYRLLSENEWELACRAGTSTHTAIGLGAESILARYAVMQTARVARSYTKLPNSWGLFDMYGNMSEWCEETDSPAPGYEYHRVAKGLSLRMNFDELDSAWRAPVPPFYPQGIRVGRTAP
jgi:formylglycine-generating enzyme required for sulfatase activity